MKRLLRPPLGEGRKVVEQQWTLNPMQWQFVSCEQRFSFYVGGVGAGKTFSGAVRAIARALDYPGSLGLIGAPTYAMLRDATQRAFFQLLPELYIQVFNKAEGHLTLRNGSEILFRSLDEPDRVRGLNLAWFWLDEAPLCGYYAWMVLKGRPRQRGYPTAGWATGTPHGRDGFARDFELERRRNHALFRASSYSNLHNLPPDYVTELGYTGAFYDQEVMGEFSAFEGLVYAFDTGAGGHVREPGKVTTEHAERTEARRNAEDAEKDAEKDAEGTQRGEMTAESQRNEVGKHGERQERAAIHRSSILSSSSATSASSSPSSVFKMWKTVIGGIDWGYTNPTAAVVFGVDGDGRVWQLDEFYQRKAALEETVLPAVLDLTRRYGVTTWYCGPDEPEHIARLGEALAQEGLRCRALRADNAIAPGIQTVTSLLARREDGVRGLYVSPRCVHTIAEYLSYQYAASPEAPPSPARKGVGGLGGVRVSEAPLKQNDHCFGAGTPVLTSTGEQAIETVQVGDLVLTRKGYRRVLAAGCTNLGAKVYCVEFSNRVKLVGTGNHPVWVVGRGWFPIDALRYAMQVETASITGAASCQRTAATSIQDQCASDMRSSSISTASRSVATPLIPATGRGTTTHRGREIDRRVTNRITGKSGSGRTGRYQRGITSTTSTGTHSTTGWRTLNVCQERSTCCAITASGSLSVWRGSVSGLTPSVLRLRLGMEQRRVGHGTRSTARRPGKVVSRGRSVAITAGLRSSHGTGWHGSAVIARTNVGLLRDGRGTRMTRGGRAHGAGLSSAATATPICDSAPVRVLRVTSMPDRVPVFNLTVDGEPEYYAAGVLVHNCMDATRYALHTALGQRRATRAYLDSMRRPPAAGNRDRE